jgi:hypothetical protein
MQGIFQRHQEQALKHPNLVDLITTKQNKLPSFIDILIQTKRNIKPKNIKLIIIIILIITHFIQGSQVKSGGFANPKRYEREK